MRIKFLDLKSQYLKYKKEIDSAIFSTINKSIFIGGEVKTIFEKKFSKYINSKYCLGVANGTDAIEISLECLNLPKNSEVIVPSNSFISTSEAVTRSGLKVVFCDISPDNYTIDTKKILKLINKRTSAIIAVHLYGHPCNMDNLLKIKKKYNLKLIEDCAQAHGAFYKKKHVGTFGDISTFSFYPGKNLGAYGDAGVIVTNNKKLYLKSKMLANHGRINKFDNKFEGRNSRLDTIQASILLIKLKYLEDLVKKRNLNANIYKRNLNKNKLITLPINSSNIRHAYHLFVIRVNNRKKLITEFEKNNIEYGIHYPKALFKLSAYKHIKQNTKNFTAGKIDDKIISIPIHEFLKKEHIIKVCTIINSYNN